MNESKRVAPSLREIEDDKKAPKVKAKDGKYMSCRGMGAAIQGGKFKGTT
jgi:hypothetical protein